MFISTSGMFCTASIYGHTFPNGAVEWYNIVTVVRFTVQQVSQKCRLVSAFELHITWNDAVFMNVAGLQIASW